MVDGVKGGRDIKEAKAGDLLMRDGRDKFIVERSEKCFGGVLFSKAGLVWVKE